MTRKPFPLEKRNPRLKQTIETWFKEHRQEDITLGEILDKYFTTGQSDLSISRELERMMRIKIPRSTLGACIRLEIECGRTNFRFDSKKPGNPLRKHGSGRKPRILERPQFKKLDVSQVSVNFECQECGTKYTKKMFITEDGLLNLMAYPCKECGEIGTGKVHYAIGNQTYYKRVADTEIPGVQDEVFTDDQYIPLQEEVV